MNKKITISLPEELFCKLEEEALKNQLSFDELLLRKLNKVYSELEERYLTNKVKNTRIDYLEKERDRLLKQMYEGRLYSNEQFQLECIERELEEFIPKTEEEKRFDELIGTTLDDFFGKTPEEQNKMAEESSKRIKKKLKKKSLENSNKEIRTEESIETDNLDKQSGKNLLEEATKEPEKELSWKDILSNRRTTEEIKRDIEELNKKSNNEKK